MNTILNIKLETFINHLIPKTQKIKILNSYFTIVFKGSLDELHKCTSPDILNSTVNMVAADNDGYLYINCR